MMNSYHISLIERGRRAWWRHRGEQPLVTTFWPQDYPRGAECQIGAQWFQITRYARAADPQCFEVWGKAVRRGVAQGEAGRPYVSGGGAGNHRCVPGTANGTTGQLPLDRTTASSARVPSNEASALPHSCWSPPLPPLPLLAIRNERDSLGGARAGRSTNRLHIREPLRPVQAASPISAIQRATGANRRALC